MTARQIRLYHWREALAHRKLANKAREKGMESSAQHWDSIASRHMTCVCAMNDLPELLHTTAEQDAAVYTRERAKPDA